MSDEREPQRLRVGTPDSALPVRMLVVEDDRALSDVLCDELRARGHVAVAAETVAVGRERLEQSDYDVALVDLQLPDGSGTEILKQIEADDLPMEAIVLTGYATVSSAIDAMKLGAYDYVTKPARMEEIEVLVQKAAEKARLRRENARLKLRLERQDTNREFVTEDPAMRELLAALERAAPSELAVLVQGEVGTGKELVARTVHRLSPRASEPFLAIDCGAVAADDLEGELFGHEKEAMPGASRRRPGLFELADRGVLFLEDVDAIPASVQARLLRALENRELVRVGGSRPVRSDVRLVSATSKDLKHAAQNGAFREDLFHRLDGVTLRLPPLRERRGDIALLARHFVDGCAPEKKLASGALDALQRYSWPGNVRELQMVVHRACILSARDTIDTDDLPLDVRDPSGKSSPARTGLTLAEMEMEYIETVLRQNEGHRGKTARALGIDPKTLYNKLGPERPRKKASPGP